MLDEATAREVCAKVQKMRKEAGLRKEDQIEVFFEGRGDGGLLNRILKEQARADRPIPKLPN